MVRLAKVFWGLSLIIVLGTLLYVYAALPEQVTYVLSDNGISESSVSRDTFFYLALSLMSLSNFGLYALSRNMKYKRILINEIMKGWQFSFAAILNFFYITIFSFFFLVNSGENFDYDNFGYLIFFALGLVVLWVLALPILLMREQMGSKN